MAKIVYSLSGEGSGHSSRSREMITHLIKKGHTVKVASYDRGYQNLKNDFDVLKLKDSRSSVRITKYLLVKLSPRTLLLYWIDLKLPIFSNRSILRNSSPIV